MRMVLPRRVRLAAVLLALLAACDEERGSVPPPALTDPARHPLHVGLRDDGGSNGVIGQVVAARLTASGRRAVVLDLVAPYVKVFESDGRLHAAFVRAGGGPGEARRPSAIAVAGDTAVLLADGGGSVSLFGMDGALRARALLSGLLVLAAAPCPDGWILYGPRAVPGAPPGQVAWLHRARFVGPDSVQVQSLLPDSVPASVPVGTAYGLAADDGGAVVRHAMTGRPRVVRLACAAGDPQVLHVGEPLPARPDPRPTSGGLQTSVRAGMRAPAGLAALGGDVVFGERVFLGTGGRDRLDLTLLSGGAARTVSLSGDYAIRDSRPGAGVLLSTSDPVPQVFIVRPAEFLAIFEDR